MVWLISFSLVHSFSICVLLYLCSTCAITVSHVFLSNIILALLSVFHILLLFLVPVSISLYSIFWLARNLVAFFLCALYSFGPCFYPLSCWFIVLASSLPFLSIILFWLWCYIYYIFPTFIFSTFL